MTMLTLLKICQWVHSSKILGNVSHTMPAEFMTKDSYSHQNCLQYSCHLTRYKKYMQKNIIDSDCSECN